MKTFKLIIVLFAISYILISILIYGKTAELRVASQENGFFGNGLHSLGKQHLKGHSQQLQNESSISSKSFRPRTGLSDFQKSIIANPFKFLNVYPEIQPPYVRPQYNISQFALHHEDDYCERADLYNLNHPQNVFENRIFYSNYPEPSKLI